MKNFLKIMMIATIALVGVEAFAGKKPGIPNQGPSTKEKVMVIEHVEDSSAAISVSVSLDSSVTQTIGVIPNTTNPKDQIITTIASDDTATTVDLSGATSFMYGVIDESGQTLTASTQEDVKSYTSFIISQNTDLTLSIAGS